MAEREMRNRSLFASVHRCGGTDDGCRDEASAGAMTNVQDELRMPNSMLVVAARSDGGSAV